MIFLTVGHDIPFDRLVRAVDNWCEETGRSDVFGQIADVGQNGYKPRHFQWKEFLTPAKFRLQFERADLVVAHAGTGTIITALMMSKPIIIMPRRSDQKETRNDHQIATAERFVPRQGVDIAVDEVELKKELNIFKGNTDNRNTPSISPFAEPRLTDALRNFVLDNAWKDGGES